MRLPAELRIEVYRLLLASRTIHIEAIQGTEKPMTRKLCELSFNICTANNAMGSLARLTGASHAQDQSSATSHGTQRPCLSGFNVQEGACHDTIRLDVQPFRVCCQVYNEGRPRYYHTPRTVSSLSTWATQTFGKHSPRNSVSRGVVP